MPTTVSYKDMPIWQRSMQLAVDIYQITAQLPATERLGICTDLQKAAVHIPTVIATGTRAGRSGFREACLSGRQSCAEVETLLLIMQQMYATMSIDHLLAEANDIQAALTGMAKRLDRKPAAKNV